MRLLGALGILLTVGVLGWLYQKTSSLTPEDHAHVDSALRELRSLDRTINQDVLRARYQLIGSYDPVLRSYRRTEELEAALASPPKYLDAQSRDSLISAVTAYRASVTAKQRVIEDFKYASAELKELLGYLPGAGTGVAKAATESGDERIAGDVNRVLQQTLLYNLTSDEKYAPIIGHGVDGLSVSGERAKSYLVKRRVRTLVMNIRTLLKVKPVVDRLLVKIFEEPVTQHEEQVAHIYYAGYAAAEHVAGRYRMGLYGLVIALLALVGYGVRRLQHSATELQGANEKLEERVADRTRELDSRNREMRAVLDNVDQALFTVDLEGKISRERSSALDSFFPNAAPGALFWDVVGEVDSKAGTWISMGWDQLRDVFLPIEVVLDQLPRALAFRGRHFSVSYRPVGNEAQLEKVLLVVSDVTDAVERARREADQQEQLVIFQHLMRDRSAFMEFFAEAERLAEGALGDPRKDHASLIRDVHTLKGNAALFGVSSVSSVCHELEAKLIESGEALELDDRTRLQMAWGHFSAKVQALAGSAQEERVELSRTDLQSLRVGIAQGKSAPDLLRLLRHLEREPASRRLARISEQAKALARRLGKGEIVVSTESNDVRLDRKRWAPFWAAFIHMLRNALDHGLEKPAEREKHGKLTVGHLALRAKQVHEQVVVEISDDGRGIDWEKIRVKGAALGLATATEDDLLGILFRGGVSTKESVTELSGRGAGVSACYNACLLLGGTVAVQSTQGAGTTFRFTIPSDDAPSVSQSSAA
jgi:HPt (histidine-containing phosphotransfer) domain-containing protein